MTLLRIVDSVRLVRDRHEHCYKVPLLLIVYVIFLVLFVLRADISNSFDFEEGLLACTGLSGDDGVAIIRDSGVTSQNLGTTVYTWLQNNLLPRIFRDESTGSDSVWTKLAVSCGSSASGSSINVATVGGLRVSQWRRSPRRSCDLGKESLGSLLGSSEFEALCHSSREALDPTLVPFFGVNDIASEYNISEAFSALPEELRLKLVEGSLNEMSKSEITLAARAQAVSPMPPLALGFHSIFSPALLELTMASSRTTGLRESKWIDDNTLDVEVGAAFLNRENSRIALLRVDFHSTIGMRLDISAELRSLPVDPYKQVSSLPWADAFFILLSILLTGSWIYNSFIILPSAFSKLKEVNVKPLASTPPPERNAQTPEDAYAVEGHVDVPSNATTTEGLGRGSSRRSRNETLQGTELFFWILHGGSSISLISLIILWSLLVSELSSARSILVKGQWESPSGKFAQGSVEFDTMLLHRSLAKANLLQADVLLCGISTITFLTFTILYLFRLQPHLAILGKCIWRGLSDILHLAIVLAVITAAYGVVGHVAFGAQSLEWSSVKTSAWTLSRMFIAWDYSLAPMQKANPALANTFVGTFMFLIANMMVWVWFTIIIETYSAAKVALKEGGERVPTVVGDILSGLNSAKNLVVRILFENRASETGEASGGITQSTIRLYKSWIKILHAHNRMLDALEDEVKNGDVEEEKQIVEKLASRLTSGKGCRDEQGTFINLLEALLSEYTSCGDSSISNPRLSEHLLSLTDMVDR